MEKTDVKRERPRLLRCVGMALLIVMVFSLAFFLTVRIRDDLEARRVEAIYEAVESAALQCYAVEGVYPGDLSYLEQHYGVMIDHDRYIVSYESFASNRAPNVMVLKK